MTAVAEGMSGVVVDQRIATPVTSPLVQSKGVPTTLKRTLRQRPDFTVVTGKLTCVGTLEQALRTLATLRAQPWAHRLDAFSITPANKERTRFTLEVEVATLFMPDLAPREDKEPVLVSPGTLSEQEWRPIAAKNIFVKPVRETPQAPVAQGTPPPPPPAPAPAAHAVRGVASDCGDAVGAAGERGVDAELADGGHAGAASGGPGSGREADRSDGASGGVRDRGEAVRDRDR